MKLGFWDTGSLLIALLNIFNAVILLGTPDFWAPAAIAFALALLLDGT